MDKWTAKHNNESENLNVNSSLYYTWVILSEV